MVDFRRAASFLNGLGLQALRGVEGRIEIHGVLGFRATLGFGVQG